ncbi:RLA class II histocompatibility antigen, DP alpha-1 chain-like [Astyanax mexicanus]|uniref:RLA class II histocompatibility antigen, DP alpha-1 chain-like n=1 Tax=Astyanax mexicanus TaxID=7994 RepID=UPI0020CB2071|nr:RLA class II histocompatibility antigen, DP alpha-1 chain-like [Astyanax mexicanus]
MKLTCDENDAEVYYHYKEQMVAYYDNKAGRVVTTVPELPDPFVFPDVSRDAVNNENYCKKGLTMINEFYANQTEELEPPWVSLYPKRQMELSINNTLICHILEFFPPPVRVTWTRNNLNMKEGVTLSPYYQNNDGTISVFSTLSFIPEEGDIYSCTVEHRALERPLTRILDVEVDKPSVLPTVVCAVGLCLGVAGAAAGVFLIFRANKHQN